MADTASTRMLLALALVAVTAGCSFESRPAYPTNCLREASSEAAELECLRIHREQYQENHDD